MNKFSWPDPPNPVAFPIARPGYPVIFASGFVTFVFALLGLTPIALLCLAFTFFTCYFFRDPERLVPLKEDAVVSPADGKVIITGSETDSPYYEGECRKISIFMSVFNVHVNRIPYDGKITKVLYFPGKFFSANLDKASKENEHNAIFIETIDKKRLTTVQIAGLIARRIICNVQQEDRVTKGQRFGMICFGSRLDIYLPPDTTINVAVGDKVQAGTTILGYFH